MEHIFIKITDPDYKLLKINIVNTSSEKINNINYYYKHNDTGYESTTSSTYNNERVLEMSPDQITRPILQELYMLKNKETIKQRANEFNKLKREELANLKQIKAKYDKLIKEQEENDTSKNKYIELNTHLMTEVYSLKQENEILKKLLRE